MIHDADQTLGRFLAAEVIGAASIDIGYEAPNRPWIQGLRRPALNCFLYDVRENVDRRDVMAEPVYNDAGIMIARRPPARWYDLFYAVTAWGLPPAIEHRVLASVIAALSGHDVVPDAYVVGDLAEQARLIFLSVAGGMKRGMLQNMSGDLKASIEVSLTIALPAYEDHVAAPAVRRPMTVSVNGGEAQESRSLPMIGATDRVPAASDAVPAASALDGSTPDAGAEPAPVESVMVRSQRLLAAEVAEHLAKAPPRPAAAPPGSAPGQRPSGPPATGGGQRPAGAPATAGGRRPAGAPASGPSGQPAGAVGPSGASPVARLSALLAQAAQIQAAIAQTRAEVATMLARTQPPSKQPEP